MQAIDYYSQYFSLLSFAERIIHISSKCHSRTFLSVRLSCTFEIKGYFYLQSWKIDLAGTVSLASRYFWVSWTTGAKSRGWPSRWLAGNESGRQRHGPVQIWSVQGRAMRKDNYVFRSDEWISALFGLDADKQIRMPIYMRRPINFYCL